MYKTCRKPLVPTLCVLILSLALQACSGSDGTASPSSNGDENSGPGWSLDGDPGKEDMQSYPDGGEDSLDFGLPVQNNGSPNATTPPVGDMGPGPAVDMGPGGPRDMAPVPVDMAPPTGVDMGPPAPVDMGSTTPDMSTPSTGGEGDTCGTTSECGAGLVCCPGFGTDTCTLENQCLVGGLCQSDAECPGQQTCCDYAQFGAPNVCADRCRGGGGGGGGGNPGNMGCQNNSECSGGEVCCPSFSGASSCEPSNQCNTGGRCQADTDCTNGQSCCIFGGNGVCLNQCSF